jgi:hypothetical protein
LELANSSAWCSVAKCQNFSKLNYFCRINLGRALVDLSSIYNRPLAANFEGAATRELDVSVPIIAISDKNGNLA